MKYYGLVFFVVTACTPSATETAQDPVTKEQSLEGVGELGTFHFALALDPATPSVGEIFQVLTIVSDAGTGAFVENLQLTLDATMPHHGHGMLTKPEHFELGSGRYVSRGMKLHMPGTWVFEAVIHHPQRERLRLRFEHRP